MRLALVLSAAAAIAASAAVTIPPASAQVGVEIGTPGVGVRVGEPRYYDERRRRVRVYERDTVGECRTVTVRKERGDGTIVTRRERPT
jgi:hypothetical protein